MSALPQAGESVLSRELAAYRRLFPTFAERLGSYAVVSGDRLLGVFPEYEQALRAGYNACGVRPFLVKQIEEPERILHFTRDIAPCPR